jgi:predicted DNA-binding transcriptional regulator YafY
MENSEFSNDRFGKQLRVIITMLDGQYHSAAELSEILGTTRRNFYFLLQQLRSNGFTIEKEGSKYALHPLSPVFQTLFSVCNFTNEEAVYMHSLLSAASKDNVMAGILQSKLERFYGLKYFTSVTLQRKVYLNILHLMKAIKHKRIVVLHDYASSHSQTVSDRIVEPYLFLGNKTDVRAFEPKSGMNKSFKITRIGKVEILDASWFNEAQHKDVFTDMFLFSGEVRLPIELRFDVVAHNLMLEEYPHSAKYMTEEKDNHWLFKTDVVKYEGIARFILGLYNHVEILGDEGLKNFVSKAIDEYVAKRSRVSQ